MPPLQHQHTRHTSSLQLHPHTHDIVTPGFVGGSCRSDCTAGHVDVEAGWWTTSGKIGLPTLARFMGVGRQQQQQDPSFSINYHELTIAGLIVKIYLEPVFRSFTELNKQYKIYCNQNQMPVRRLYKYRFYF